MRHIFLCSYVAAVLLVISAACSHNDTRLCAYRELDKEGWAYGDTLTFPTDALTDSMFTGHVVVALRHNNAYPYSNLWLEVTSTSDRNTIRRDTLNCRLADIYGRWAGRGFGASFQYCDTLPSAVTIKRGTPIEIRHIMRVDTLQDIEHLGIMLVP